MGHFGSDFNSDFDIYSHSQKADTGNLIDERTQAHNQPNQATVRRAQNEPPYLARYVTGVASIFSDLQTFTPRVDFFNLNL